MCGMKFQIPRIPGYLVGAVVLALVVGYVAHTVFGLPRVAIRQDALGAAAGLAAFMAAGALLPRRRR